MIIALFGLPLPEELTDVNVPGVVLLATSGVGAMFFIVRWMIKYQREFTNFRTDPAFRCLLVFQELALETVIARHEATISHEAETNRRHEDTIAGQAAKIERHEVTIGELSRRHRDQPGETADGR